MKNFNKKLILIGKFLYPLWFFLSLFNFLKNKSLQNKNTKKIIVFEFHLIGDIVLLIPFLHLLRNSYPDYKITLVAGEWANSILSSENLIDDHIVFNAPWVKYNQGIWGYINLILLIFNLRKYSWDIGFEMRGDFRQILTLFFVGAKHRFGLNLSGAECLLTEYVVDDGNIKHLSDHHVELAKVAGIWRSNSTYVPKLTVSDCKKFSISSKFQASPIGIHLGASLPLRRLPISQAKKLISFLSQTDRSLLLFQPPGMEREISLLFNSLATDIRCNITIWGGSLQEMIVAIGSCSELHAMDSAAAHISAALGVKTFVYFGPALPIFSKPIGDQVHVVEISEVKCRPCDQRHCTNKKFQACMEFFV